MSTTDVAFIIDSSNSLALAFGNSFYNAFYQKDSNIISVSNDRLAAVYNPTLYFYVNASVDPNASARGFYIECSAYTQLVQVLITSLTNCGMPIANELGYIVKPIQSAITGFGGTTTNYLKLYIGYSTNSSDMALLSGNSLATIVSKLIDSCFLSNTLTPVADSSNLAVDPNFSKNLWSETKKSSPNYGKLGSTTIDSQPINYLTIARENRRDSSTYLWESKYATDSESSLHTLVFSAKPNSAVVPTSDTLSEFDSSLLFRGIITNTASGIANNTNSSDMYFQVIVGIDHSPAVSSNQPNTITVLIGDTYSTVVTQTGEFQTFSLDFYPEQIDPLHSDIAFNATVYTNPYLINELPFNFNIGLGRYVLTDELPMSFDVASKYRVFFGLSAPCAVDIASIDIVKRSALLELDNPVDNYSVVPTYTDQSGNVVDPTTISPISPSVTQKATTLATVTTTPASISSTWTNAGSGASGVTISNSSGASAVAGSTVSSALPGLSSINSIEASIMGFANSITSIMGSVDKVAAEFGISFVDPTKKVSDYASLEKSLQDPTLTGEQRTKITNVMNTLKKVQRMQTTITTTEKDILSKINAEKAKIYGPITASMTQIGTQMLKVTKEMDAIKAAAQGLQNGILSQVNSTLTKLGASSAIAKLLSKKMTTYVPGVVQINFLTSSSIYKAVSSVDSQIKVKDFQINNTTNQVNTALTSPSAWQVNTANQGNSLSAAATQLSKIANGL